MDSVIHSYVIQKGSSQTMRVCDENRFYVVREDWEGSQLLNSVIVFSSPDREEAENWRAKNGR